MNFSKIEVPTCERIKQKLRLSALIQWATTADQGVLPLNVNGTFRNATEADVMATYSIGQVTGLSTIYISSLELVPNSADIDVPALAFFGARESTWAGTWEMSATFCKSHSCHFGSFGKDVLQFYL